MRVILVHNPTSGDDDHTGERLVELVAQAGHQVEYFRSKSAWHAALGKRPDLVVVAGGDGGCMVHLDDELWQGDAHRAVVAELAVEPGAMTFLVCRARRRPGTTAMR